LVALQAENESLKGQYMRIAADFDNFRKRQSRDQDDLRLKIICSTLSEILPVVDNFDRARQQLNPQSEEAQGLHRSYQNLYKQLVDVFKQLGVSPMRVEGEPFDPTLHEAVLREPSQEHPEDVVIEELQRGYHLNGRVLRHALVKVSMGPGPGGAPLTGADLGPAEQAG
jgi:molecular chaperone GrpE